MIRNQQGNEFFLFTQDEHARFSGFLAERIGNGWFTYPQPRKPVIEAIAMHDCGWALHDNEPTLNEAGMPLDVFETPIDIASRVWSESVRYVRQVHPYAALLVSLHVFNLSAMSHQPYADAEEKRRRAREVFALNKFQQSQIELQEQIRTKMGMRTDVALQLGLGARGSGEAEDLLRFNFHLLKAMDQLSLAVLCGNHPFTTLEEISPRPYADPVDLRVLYPAPWTVSISPWPFGVEQIEAHIPFRRLPGQAFAGVEEFRKLYAETEPESQVVRVVKSGV